MNASGFGFQCDSNVDSGCTDKRARLLLQEAASAVSVSHRDPRASRHRFRVALVATLVASQMFLLLLLASLLLHLALLLRPASAAPAALPLPRPLPLHLTAASADASADLQFRPGHLDTSGRHPPQHLRVQHPELVDALHADALAPRELLRRLRADSPTAARLRLALGALLADAAADDAALSADCTALADLRDAEYLASGWTKAVFRARLPSPSAGEPLLALKVVDPRGKQMLQCLQSDAPLHCRHEASLKLLSEALLLRRLQHPAVLRVRASAYCTNVHAQCTLD